MRTQAIGKGYPVFSWYSIMAGMGIFPDPAQLRSPSAAESKYSLAEIDNLIERSATHYRPHREVLRQIPARSADETLHVYFW